MSHPTRATVCFLRRDGEILLGRKKKKIGKGLWNGYGGLEETTDDAIEDTAVRETQEEIGVSIPKGALRKIAVITYLNQAEGTRLHSVEVHFYTTHEWSGTPKGGDEIDSLTWFPIDALPINEMMPSDGMWLGKALNGEYIEGSVSHGPQKEVIDATFNTLSGKAQL